MRESREEGGRINGTNVSLADEAGCCLWAVLRGGGAGYSRKTSSGSPSTKVVLTCSLGASALLALVNLPRTNIVAMARGAAGRLLARLRPVESS